MLSVFNTLTRQKEPFKPITPGVVKMYVCGPTVYNYIHIGNARSAIAFDTIRRYFEYFGYHVDYVSNFTDVDDKIINRAIEENTTEAVIAQRYIDAYQALRVQLNTQIPDITPRVTETMDDIIAFIQEMVNNGSAYVSENGDVYFSVEADERYGEISHQNLDMLEAGARIDVNQGKKNPYDFALWKKTDKGIQWDSPWGKGRPGWHTECVVMINKNLGEIIDIHGGGMDLKFPHHENEAAQQECTHHNALANYWVHNAMINIDGQKMSKSLGNTLWAKDIIDQLGTGLTRWLMSSVHYRKELNFSEETVETARKELEKVLNPLKQADIRIFLAQAEVTDEKDEESFRSFLDQLDDDLNTPNVYTVIFETVKKLNQSLRVREIDYASVNRIRNAVTAMLDVLGINVERTVLSEEDRELFRGWNEAKKAKDWGKADTYRNALSGKGLL